MFLGYMVDFQLFKELGLNLFPNLPQQDVGDNVTLKLREVGMVYFPARILCGLRNLMIRYRMILL